jgi:hypothetical protein
MVGVLSPFTIDVHSFHHNTLVNMNDDSIPPSLSSRGMLPIAHAHSSNFPWDIETYTALFPVRTQHDHVKMKKKKKQIADESG